jgi:hypothetical protein
MIQRADLAQQAQLVPAIPSFDNFPAGDADHHDAAVFDGIPEGRDAEDGARQCAGSLPTHYFP